MALNRKETRGLHVRPDYPFTNPVLAQAHVIRIKKTNHSLSGGTTREEDNSTNY
jgi:succinate dehydrogenase/fumarate reductase flavoprotein subunit